IGPWMFQEIGSSLLMHFDGSDTTRSRPVTFRLQAWITALSSEPVAASAAKAPPLASTAMAAARTNNRVRWTRKTWGITLLSLGPSVVAAQVCRVSDRSVTKVQLSDWRY